MEAEIKKPRKIRTSQQERCLQDAFPPGGNLSFRTPSIRESPFLAGFKACPPCERLRTVRTPRSIVSRGEVRGRVSLLFLDAGRLPEDNCPHERGYRQMAMPETPKLAATTFTDIRCL